MGCEVCGLTPVTMTLDTPKGPFGLCGHCEMTCRELIRAGVRHGTWALRPVTVDEATS